MLINWEADEQPTFICPYCARASFDRLKPHRGEYMCGECVDYTKLLEDNFRTIMRLNLTSELLNEQD